MTVDRHSTVPTTPVPPPVRFRGIDLRGEKCFREGTHRSRPPEETQEAIRPFLPVAGVTRVADITGLDIVGLPTTLAFRPNSATMACSSGKGLTSAAAFVSGAMEAIELYSAETIEVPSIFASYEDMATRGSVVPENRLPLAKRSLFNRRWPFLWSYTWDICSQMEVAVPLGVLQMARTSQITRHLGAFQVSSNGLGSGNIFLEAILAALYEVIERDGVTCHRLAWQHGTAMPAVVSDTLLRAHPAVSDVINRCEDAGVGVRVYDCMVDTKVPTYMAYVFDRIPVGHGIFRGYGAHLDVGIAILRALSEALQGRLNYIAGSRDDIFRAGYWRLKASDNAKMILSFTEDVTTVAPENTSTATSTFEGDVHTLLAQLSSAGFGQVLVSDMTPAGFPISVVRVIVPGLEGYMHFGFHPGERGRRHAEEGL